MPVLGCIQLYVRYLSCVIRPYLRNAMQSVKLHPSKASLRMKASANESYQIDMLNFKQKLTTCNNIILIININRCSMYSSHGSDWSKHPNRRTKQDHILNTIPVLTSQITCKDTGYDIRKIQSICQDNYFNAMPRVT